MNEYDEVVEERIAYGKEVFGEAIVEREKKLVLLELIMRNNQILEVRTEDQTGVNSESNKIKSFPKDKNMCEFNIITTSDKPIIENNFKNQENNPLGNMDFSFDKEDLVKTLEIPKNPSWNKKENFLRTQFFSKQLSPKSPKKVPQLDFSWLEEEDEINENKKKVKKIFSENSHFESTSRESSPSVHYNGMKFENGVEKEKFKKCHCRGTFIKKKKKRHQRFASLKTTTPTSCRTSDVGCQVDKKTFFKEKEFDKTKENSSKQINQNHNGFENIEINLKNKPSSQGMEGPDFQNKLEEKQDEEIMKNVNKEIDTMNDWKNASLKEEKEKKMARCYCFLCGINCGIWFC